MQSGKYSCVLCRQLQIVTSTKSGVRPLLDWLDEDTDFTGYIAGDKVVGKAAAYLYIRLGISELYALTITRSAIDILRSHGILVHGVQVVDHIQNRQNTGICPMEEAVGDITDPVEAEKAIRQRLMELAK